MKNKNQILKNNFHVLTSFTKIFTISMVVAMASCTKSNKVEDTKEVAEEHNEAKFENSDETDAQFLVRAAEINLEEIQLGQLAQNKSANEEVQKLGKMMEKEHSKSFEELKALAAKKQITIPTSLTDKGIDANKKLSNMMDDKFDKEYCAMMVNGHKDAIDHFEKIVKKSTDSDIKDWAIEVLPSLRTHLDQAITCKEKCDKIN